MYTQDNFDFSFASLPVSNCELISTSSASDSLRLFGCLLKSSALVIWAGSLSLVSGFTRLCFKLHLTIWYLFVSDPDITLLTRVSARQLHGATCACLGLIPLLLVIIVWCSMMNTLEMYKFKASLVIFTF